MTLFYEKALADEALGPFFTLELGEDMHTHEWIEHVELLADFWLAKLLGTDTYIGNFVGAHVRLPHIKKEMVSIWMALFSETLDEVYIPDVAGYFKHRTRHLIKEFLNSAKNI